MTSLRSVVATIGDLATSIRPPRRCPDPDNPNAVDDTFVLEGQGILDDGDPSDARMANSLKNGCYQHIMSLGISSFVICNHCDREILLVDPWPTFHSEWTRLIPRQNPRPLTEQSRNAKTRLAGLASFLRKAVNPEPPLGPEQAYSLTGILVSHMHFDHADDIVLLLELLAAETTDDRQGDVQLAQTRSGDNTIGAYSDHQGRRFLLAGSPVSVDALPKICCDYDSLLYLLSYNFYVNPEDIDIHGNDMFIPPDGPLDSEDRPIPMERYWYGNPLLKERLLELQDEIQEDRWSDTWRSIRERYVGSLGENLADLVRGVVDNASWYEINHQGQRLHYDDSYNAYLENESDRCKAGQVCGTIQLGHFDVTPYIWDHMNVGFGKFVNLALDEQSSGDLQRITAYLVKRNGIRNAKRTFIVGSSGEMNEAWTEALIPENELQQLNVETDLLIHAITRHRPHWLPLPTLRFRLQIRAYMQFITRHVEVTDALVFIHFEEFVREVADAHEYREALVDALEYNLARLSDEVDELREEENFQKATVWSRMVDEAQNRVYVLKRRGIGFEAPMPTDPFEFFDEDSE